MDDFEANDGLAAVEQWGMIDSIQHAPLLQLFGWCGCVGLALVLMIRALRNRPGEKAIEAALTDAMLFGAVVGGMVLLLMVDLAVAIQLFFSEGLDFRESVKMTARRVTDFGLMGMVLVCLMMACQWRRRKVRHPSEILKGGS